MDKDGKFYEYRQRLDKTLASPELTDLDALKALISKQLQGSNEEVLEKRATEASDFLDMLRSAAVSGTEYSSKTKAASVGEWNLKESNEEYRVMYRKGPQGTPMHTLFVEGYVDGPIESCLCIGWETTLYNKWWPQLSFPNFKISMSKSLQKVQFGEQVSLLRVKITWPLSAREIVLHYFMFEYLQEGLVVVLLNSISDSENLDVTTHGFTREGIPEPVEVVRIDLVGGFAVQGVNSERSYVCLIGNIDFKLDLVPSSLINFVARQVIGGGYKLYQKAVVSTSKRDEDYVKALKDPMYARLRNIFHDSSSNDPRDIKLPEDAHSEHHTDDQNVIMDDKDDHADAKEETSKPLNDGATNDSNMPSSSHEVDSEDEYEQKFHHQYGALPICPDIILAFSSLERATSSVKRYGVNVLTRSFSRVVVANPDAPMEEDKTLKLEATLSKDGGVEGIADHEVVSDSLMENAPAPIKCSPRNYKSWDESGLTRDCGSRGVISELEMNGTGYEKKARRRRKRRYIVSCFGL